MTNGVPTYRIRDWDKHFENHDSRKIRSLTWVPVKNKHDGRGYRRVARLPNSVQVFCGFILMVEVASKMPTRGTLRDDDGALTALDLADKTGYPASVFDAAMKALVQEGVRWLEIIEIESPNGTRRDAAGHDGLEGKGMEQKGSTPLTPQGVESGVPTSLLQSVEDIMAAYPRQSHLLPGKAVLLDKLRAGADAAIVLAGVRKIAGVVRLWKSSDRRFIPSPDKFFAEERWTDDAETWRRDPDPKETTMADKQAARAEKLLANL